MHKGRMSACLGFPLILLFLACPSRARDIGDNHPKSNQKVTSTLSLPNTQSLQPVGVHDAGKLYNVFAHDLISTGFASVWIDPETGGSLYPTTYPRGSGKTYIFSGSIWIGGIVNGDTLVSVGNDGWLREREFAPENYKTGGMYRVGQYADDEFVSTTFDTFDYCDPVIDVCSHTRMGLELKQITHSWADPDYDDFIIIDYVITNIGDQIVNDPWVGIFLDGDVYHESYGVSGYMDDCAGHLDTLLDINDPESQALIAYIFDNDGDPSAIYGDWDDKSVTGAISVSLLDVDCDIEHRNFNWWISNGNAALDFGPRRLGTPEDPFREFDGHLGTPTGDENKYYILSHKEVDYDQIETAVHDSSDGWIPAMPLLARNFANGYDSRFLLSFGSSDLAPGESIAFTAALVAAEGLHVNPDDYATYFDPWAPEIYYSRLDFSELIQHHQRAFDVYRSGYVLPHPGPPQGLAITDYDDEYVDLVWNASRRPDLAGYYVLYRDTAYDDNWRHLNPNPISDTIYRFWPSYTYHHFELAVSLVDDHGGESGLSIPVEIIPATPHEPLCLEAALDGAVPVLTWQTHSDSANVEYIIYRSVWDGAFVKYDMTAGTNYRDEAAESGIRYSYKVSTINDRNLESDQAGPVTVIPMAMDKGALFINNNKNAPGNHVGFDSKYVTDLYNALAVDMNVGYFYYQDWDRTQTMKAIADHSPLIISSESRYADDWLGVYENYMRIYFERGGKAVLILNSAVGNILSGLPWVIDFQSDDIHHDILKLDSCVVNNIVVDTDINKIVGDLQSCEPLNDAYGWLHADNAKIAALDPPVDGFVPMSGYLFPTEEAEPIYRYISNNPDTINHHQINGIRYLGEDYQFVLFNFPLSLMAEPASIEILKQALSDLGVIPTQIDEVESVLPEKYALHQNYPNPFNAGTTIEIYNGGSLPVEATLRVYNILGQKVATLVNGFVPPGLNKVDWNGRDDSGRAVASGIYFYHLAIDDAVYTRKMLLIK